MADLFPRISGLIVALGLGVAVGCQKAAPPNPATAAVQTTPPAAPATPAAPAATAAKEDPEVVDFIKQKGWWLAEDTRISDGKRLAFLTVRDPQKSFEDIKLTPDDFKMIARAKTVQVLDLRQVKNLTDDTLKTIAGMPQLEGILVMCEEVTDAGAKALAQCKSLDNIALFSAKKVTDAGVKELAALPKLQSLYLGFATLDGSAFEAFAGSKTLQSLTLDYVEGFTDDGAKNLAKLPNLNELKIGSGFGDRKLTAGGIKAIVDARLPAKFEFDKKLIDDDLLVSLVRKGWLWGPTPAGAMEKKPATPEEVKYIVLDDCKVTDKGLQAIFACTNVTSLHLQRTGVTDETLKKLPALKKLDYLALNETKVTAAGLDALAALPIKYLSLGRCELSEDAFKAFGKITALEELGLDNTKMKADWLKHIAALPKLKDLNLMQADFDDAAVKHIGGLPNLQKLCLNDTNLGDKGFQELLKLPKLQSLLVDSTKVSKDVYQKAKKDHPKLSLYYYAYDK
jgi:hypothetical protein